MTGKVGIPAAASAAWQTVGAKSKVRVPPRLQVRLLLGSGFFLLLLFLFLSVCLVCSLAALLNIFLFTHGPCLSAPNPSPSPFPSLFPYPFPLPFCISLTFHARLLPASDFPARVEPRTKSISASLPNSSHDPPTAHRPPPTQLPLLGQPSHLLVLVCLPFRWTRTVSIIFRAAEQK